LQKSKQNLKIQFFVTTLSIILFVLKFVAYFMTHSLSVLSDALESIVNVLAGLIGLYSLYVASKPKDKDHPYGHGKVEFLSATVEGTLMIVSSFVIIYEAINNLKHPHVFGKLDYGIYLVAVTAIINLFAGMICVKTGKKNNSLALIASGKHLIADTYTTIGIIIGLVLLFVTGISWIDSAVAIIFALVIFYTGYKIVRSSIAGIMDEADMELLNKMVIFLNENRNVNWIDLHNLRIIKYGAMIHLDCHLTVPWYFNVHQAHDEIDRLSGLVKRHFGDSVELFVHSDGCLDFSCALCEKSECQERKHPFQKKIAWTMENISSNKKHQLD
jgi:cation diffusion facilitator family transporter